MKKTFTAEEKKQYRAQQKQEVEQALIAGVQACYTSENFRNYLNIVSKFHDYSINNCMLIAWQKPDATLVAGFSDWKKKFKRHVKAGEKAIRIIAPIKCKGTREIETAPGVLETQTFEFMRFKAVSVFDKSQTEGEELPELCKPLTGDIDDYDKIINSLEKYSRVPVEFRDFDGSANGYFSHSEQKIVVRADMSQKQTIKTLVHELAHSILHDDAFCDIPRNVKEVQAESVAYIVCNGLGIDTSDYSFEYVATWAEQDIKTLTAQMEIVRKTADAITAGIARGAN